MPKKKSSFYEIICFHTWEQKYKQWTWNFSLKKKEQKYKIPVASLDFFSHIEFAETQTLKRFEQLFILKHGTEWDISLYLVHWCTNKFCLKIFAQKKMSQISMPAYVWANVCTMYFWCLLCCYKRHRDAAEVHEWPSPWVLQCD